MEKRYINESRYKKSATRKRRNSSTVKSNMNTLNKTKVVKKKKIKKKVKKNKRVSQVKRLNTVICIILLVLIAIISRAILKDEGEPFITLSFISQANEEIINIGVITEGDISTINSNNVVINELNKYSKDMLLEVNEDYSITYRVLSDVTKISNKEYLLKNDEKSKVDSNDIKQTLENYSKDKSSIYYNKLSNITSIAVVDENLLNVKLKKDDPYFVYKLDVCLNSAKGKTNYVEADTSTGNQRIYIRNESASKELPSKIVVNKYKDMYSAVDAYKNNEIDMFVTNSENVQNILGKHEYSIKSYRNGQNIFLFGNKNSKVYSKHEVRQAVIYSLNRDGIIKDILKSKGLKIDLPYIYDEVKYKYDVYAAENILLTNNYKKTKGVYSKKENGVKTTLELNLIVNKADGQKVDIAERIKKNLEAGGIKVNIEKLSDSKIKSRIKSGDYDLLLASVNLNEIPDINFVRDNLIITDDVKVAMDSIDKATIQELPQKLNELKGIMSDEISAIGIYSDVSYLIYSKNIAYIQDVSYMNLFKDIFKD